MLSDHEWGNAVAERVVAMALPILTDLGLGLYDCEYGGGVLKVTCSCPEGTDLNTIALATRLISRELDHTDPIPGRYTLEVTSPGLERSLRRPAHFAASIGMTVAMRLHDVGNDERRVRGVISAVGDEGVTIVPEGGTDERVIPFDQIDRAKTVFEWGPAPKGSAASRPPARARARVATTTTPGEGAS